ncbi:MAG: hypothetical protein Kow0059_21960 [Candidatus Sumerlaeia bacterium]
MSFWTILLELMALLTLALLLGMLLERLRQSAILGYLTAGMLLGPGGLGFVRGEAVGSVSELGVVLLLFTIGLEFSFRRMKTLGVSALGGGVIQIVATGVLAGLVCRLLGLGLREAAAVGAMIPLSSTACVLRLLADRAELDSVHGRHALGILLLQDIAVVPLVLFMTALAGKGSTGALALDLGRAVMLAALLIVGFVVVCNYVLPFFFDVAAMTRNRDLPILLAIVTCVAASWSAHHLHLSPALGAFVAGMLLAESPFAAQIRADLSSLRALFVTLFFTSIGLLAELKWIPIYWNLLLWLLPVVVLLKAGVVWWGLRLFGVSHRHSLAAGLCLSQIGEFSFLLATLGRAGGVLSDVVFEVLLLTTFGTLFLTPFFVRVAPVVGAGVERRMLKWAGKRRVEPAADAPAIENLKGHVIIVGFGPAGRGVMDALRSIEAPVLVLELNPRGVAEARRLGLAALLGDATHADVLEHAGLHDARALVIALPDHKTSLHVLKQARSMAPSVPIIVRARYHAFARELEAAGARVVLDEEVEVGRGLAIAVIQMMMHK